MPDEDLEQALSSATAFTRSIALEIVTVSHDMREVAYQLVEQRLYSEIADEKGASLSGREFVRSQMAILRDLIARIDISGGAGGGNA